MIRRFLTWLRSRRYNPEPIPHATRTWGDDLARILESEEGIREIPRNSNRGERVEEYQAAINAKAYGLPPTGWPYCAAFICWGLARVEESNSEELPFNLPTTPRAWGLEDWAEACKLDVIDDPKPSDLRRGDVVCFDISHCGVVTGPAKGNMVPTIEGNTDRSSSVNREGGGVYRGKRHVSLFRSRIRI